MGSVRGGEDDETPRRRAPWAGLAVAVAMQPVVWAAGRWAVPGLAGGVIEDLDRAALAWMAGHRAPALDRFFAAVTWLGSMAVIGPLALGLVAALAAKGRRRRAWFVVAALGGAAIFARLGKWLVARPRPSTAAAVTAMPSDLSFPSAHATHALAIALAAWLVSRDLSKPARGAIAAGGVVAVALVAVSRVYLQVHYPSDVLAGLVAAAAWVIGLMGTGSFVSARRS